MEYLPGVREQVMDVVDIPPPSLKLLLGVQCPGVHIHHRVKDTRLEAKLLHYHMWQSQVEKEHYSYYYFVQLYLDPRKFKIDFQ